MSNERIQPGDVVRLKGGSPTMTVCSLHGEEALVIYPSHKGKLHHEMVNVAALQRLDPKPPPPKRPSLEERLNEAEP